MKITYRIFVFGALIFSLIFLLFNTKIALAADSVTLENTSPCPQSGGQNCIQHTLSVNCQGLPTRRAFVWDKKASGSTKGSIVFLAGGFGTDFYSTFGSEANKTVETVRKQGAQVFEITWDGPYGWSTNTEGFGKEASCAVPQVINWLNANKAENPSLMCATGNSGGASVLSLGMTLWGLDNVLDAVVLSGGPGQVRTDLGCFDQSSPAYFQTVEERVTNDRLAPWYPGTYCQDTTAPQDIIDIAANMGVVAVSEPRDYYYPQTKTSFIQGSLDPAQNQAILYFNQITSSKNYEVVDGVHHSVFTDPNGANRIRYWLKQTCK